MIQLICKSNELAFRSHHDVSVSMTELTELGRAVGAVERLDAQMDRTNVDSLEQNSKYDY
jgi:hypothetical protein